jgi:hypothetical protein
MKKIPQHIHRDLLAAVCDRFADQDRFCDTSFNCAEDESGNLINDMNLTPKQLVRLMVALDEACPGSLAREIEQMHISVSRIDSTATLRHFWLPWIQLLANKAGLLRTSGLAEFATAVLYM